MKSELPVLSASNWPEWAPRLRRPFHDKYFAMYSSVWEAVTTDPACMSVPMDDHVVHRGDGVFETLKCVHGGLYLLEAHLDRLENSARVLRLPLRWTRAELIHLIIQTVRAGGKRDCAVRLMLSRGPGGMGVNPLECPQPGLYLLAYQLGVPFMERHPGGARAGISSVPAKPAWLATIKTCNYLPNAFMAREASERGLDFVVGLDEEDNLAEGAVENAAIVTPDKCLACPETTRILKGTTLERALWFSRKLVQSGQLRAVQTRPIARHELNHVSEFFLIGTTHTLVAVTEFEGRPVGSGIPGHVFHALDPLLRKDVEDNAALRTPVWPDSD